VPAPTVTPETASPAARPSVAVRVGAWVSSWSPRTRTAVSLAILAILVALPVRGLMRSQGPPMEEGFMLVFPERFLAGDLPNRDFLHLYGPGSVWLLGAWFEALGTTLEVQRVFALLQQMAVIGGVYAIARQWGRTSATLCGIISLLFIVPPIGLTALAWVGGVGLGLLGLAAALRARREADDRSAGRWALTAGILFAVALLFRVDLVIAIGLSGLAVWWGATRTVKIRLVAGLGVAVVGYVVHLATAGLSNVWEGMVIDPVFNLRGGRGLPLPPSWDMYDGWLQRVGDINTLEWPVPTLEGPSQLTVWFFALVLSAVFVLAVAIRAVRNDRRATGAVRATSLALLAAALFGIGMMPQALQRADSTHLAWVSCVPVAFVPVAIMELVRSKRGAGNERRRALLAGGAVLLALLLAIPFFAFRSYVDYSAQSFGIHRTANEIRRGDRVFYYGRSDVARAVHEMIPDVERYMRPGDRLFVGTGDLRKTPFSEAWLYYLFPELAPATYFIEMDPGVANAKGSRLTSDVESADLVILSKVWDDFREPNDSRVFGPDAPNQVLRDEFCTVGEYGGLYELLVRCDRA
jgi:hypothetical protein